MKIAIITGNSYPNGDAGAVRQHAMARLLLDMGHDVIVLGYGQPTRGKVEQFEGIRYISFRGESANTYMRALNRILFGIKVRHYLKNELPDINCLLIVDLLPAAFRMIKRYAIINNIVLIHDSVEWYSPEEFSDGKRNRAYKNKEYTNTVAIDNNWNVIAISKYLERHFQSKCRNVVRIPVIMDTKSIVPRLERSGSGKILFLYAGGPGKKDLLNEMVMGFAELDDELLEQIELHIVGVNHEQLIKQCEVDEEAIDRLGASIFTHGRLPREEAIDWVKRADYTILLRDETMRYAKAGFPTKIVESLACGTPVICNISSDLEDYIEDGVNGFVVPGHMANQITTTIKRVIQEGRSSSKMREAARCTAEEHFDYRIYGLQMKSIIS